MAYRIEQFSTTLNYSTVAVKHLLLAFYNAIFTRAMLSERARVLAIRGPVSVRLCLSQVGVLSKAMDGLTWFLACRLLSLSTTPCFRESVRKIIKNTTINLIFKTAIGILVIANHNCFRVLFEKKLLPYVLFEKCIYILALEMASPGTLSFTMRKFSYLQNKGTSLLKFFLNARLQKFLHGILIVETCYQLSSRRWTLSA